PEVVVRRRTRVELADEAVHVAPDPALVQQPVEGPGSVRLREGSAIRRLERDIDVDLLQVALKELRDLRERRNGSDDVERYREPAREPGLLHQALRLV